MTAWPDLDGMNWQETAAALHLYCQIVGKYRLAHTPWVNHSWHATLYVTPRGLTTGMVPDPRGKLALHFDFHDHRLIAETPDGRRDGFPLAEGSVAEFYRRTAELISALGRTPRIHGRPNEIPDVVAFADDTARRPYDAGAVAAFHQALLCIVPVFERFRTGFLGKVSPVHLFWGSFDLAVTRFSGRPAPRHPGGIPNLPDTVTQEAYSHEVSSAGFWPGGGGEKAAFYSYAYPAPAGFADASVDPAAAGYNDALGEFLLPYDDVRRADEPENMLLSFLQSTYEAAARLGGWDRASLECAFGEPGIPRAVLG